MSPAPTFGVFETGFCHGGKTRYVVAGVKAVYNLSMKANPPRKGRGAVISPDGRFDAWQRDAAEDGWWNEDEAAPATELIADSAKSVITYNDSPDIPYDRSINPYRGCEHVIFNQNMRDYLLGFCTHITIILCIWCVPISNGNEEEQPFQQQERKAKADLTRFSPAERHAKPGDKEGTTAIRRL